MKLALPIFGTALNTLNRWSAILRQTDFVVNVKSEDLKPFSSTYALPVGSTLTIAKVKDHVCGYSEKLYPWVWVDMRLEATLGGVGDVTFYVKLPTPPTNYVSGNDTALGPVFTCVVWVAGTPYVCSAKVENNGKNLTDDYVAIRLYDSSPFPLGATLIYLSGWYRKQT